MVLRRSEDGLVWREGKLTWEEERELYARMGPPITVLHRPDKPSPQPQTDQPQESVEKPQT
jgi:hypothetical protein